MNNSRILVTLSLLAALSSCTGGRWTNEETSLIGTQPYVMRVLEVDNEADRTVLRRESKDIPAGLLNEAVFKTLAASLITTVTDPSKDGVGIAAPQVGISRRVVAVQRFDKPSEPFEVYPNIRITAMRGELQCGAEGCLSVPNRRGNVLRSRDIDITYTSPATLRDTSETVTGFTAVIFQHECDHLDGIIYTDRIW